MNLLFLLLCVHRLFSKMASFTPQEKVQSCYWVAEFKFSVTVQRRFHEKYGRAASDRHTIVQWHKHLLENGDFQRHGGNGRKRTSDENVKAIRAAKSTEVKCLVWINQFRSDRTFFLHREHSEWCGISRYV